MFNDNALKELLQSYSLYIDKSGGKGGNGSEQTKPIAVAIFLELSFYIWI